MTPTQLVRVIPAPEAQPAPRTDSQRLADIEATLRTVLDEVRALAAKVDAR